MSALDRFLAAMREEEERPFEEELFRQEMQSYRPALTAAGLPWVECTCACSPLQFEGVMPDGRTMYFRARHQQWRLGISPHGLPGAVRVALDGTEAADELFAHGADPENRIEYGDASAQAAFLALQLITVQL
ncbi:MAG: hypothetical protein JWO67_36 [Streptosporangiaceae bacterium]|nr:hypothetical protein [Streptosporangiaceae bacterium]